MLPSTLNQRLIGVAAQAGNRSRKSATARVASVALQFIPNPFFDSAASAGLQSRAKIHPLLCLPAEKYRKAHHRRLSPASVPRRWHVNCLANPNAPPSNWIDQPFATLIERDRIDRFAAAQVSRLIGDELMITGTTKHR